MKKTVEMLVIWYKDENGKDWAADFYGANASKKALAEVKAIQANSPWKYTGVDIYFAK